MNRQEALIEIMKGNVVEIANKTGRIFAKNLDKGCPKFIFRHNCGREDELDSGLDECNGPFKLVSPTRTITIDGKEIEISEESFQAFKKQFTE